ncbi:hypothetical protein [Vallitalea sp.]|jgi:beta-lactamase regulating signal transducer with metallopeptidase domain|uniref:hypothetical protein n=1 Tax=Vallitalea sp. TaxID=1882829 RepID=UPI0025F67D1E|nr:hypothetical protein [Vallitalea sp.]MCT4687413.1 hypothetical protein [Vallitalea sp.]
MVRTEKLDEDGELYCDNEVVNFISSDDNIVYGNLIIDLASYDKDFPLPIQAVSFINNKKYIKKRVLNISYKVKIFILLQKAQAIDNKDSLSLINISYNKNLFFQYLFYSLI